MQPEDLNDIAAIKDCLEADGLNASDTLTELLWAAFSNQQAASWVIVTDENLGRFIDWIRNGFNPDDAWS